MKNVLNTTKKKVVAGVTCFTLVASGGFVFAGTDAGAQLKAWYNKQFNNAVDDATADVTDYYNKAVDKQTEWYQKTKKDTTDEVAASGDGQTFLAEKEINKAKKEHLGDLEAAKKAIIDSMEKQFDDLTDEGEAVLGEVAKKYKKLATDDLTSGINDTTGEAIDKLNAELDDATKKAKDELQAAIDRAKKDISKKLKEQTELNTRFMKDTIDKHVRSIELNINNLAIDLKKQSVAAIGKAADAKVDAAKKSLDDIVSGIK